MRKNCLLALLLLSPAIGHAYVGPGIGLGVIASLLALGSAFFVMLFHFIVAPLRKLFGKDKHKEEDAEENQDRDDASKGDNKDKSSNKGS